MVDDCPDGSAEKFIRSLGSAEVIYHRNPHPTGGWCGRVRNCGLRFAQDLGIRASFVHCFDDDDLVPAGYYSRAKQAFDEHPHTGVVFGIMTPFCVFADDPGRRQRQERQLNYLIKLRATAACLARMYQQIDAILRLPLLSRWLFALQSMFGPEMFLCSGGMIRYAHIMQMGGFDPEVWLIEDYEFFSRAIRRYGVYFLDEVATLYRSGSADSLWNPLDLTEATNTGQVRKQEAAHSLSLRQQRLRRELGSGKFFTLKIVYRAFIKPTFYRVVVPLMLRFA